MAASFSSCTLDVILTLLTCHGTYIFTMRSVDNPGNIINIVPWPFRPLALLIEISESVVRCFFVRRIWICMYICILLLPLTYFILSEQPESAHNVIAGAFRRSMQIHLGG
ncbi:hypothetical protein SCHPADRAFT_348275 [Schizopora paradoxa]|uniref:Uncharacterized protein n=1 Tax=Schizopora paradoxa TaxID=27342 RepID=A0A0H2RQ99_9AGAM|nr:hypothetical protein SCHPADRAFT_348275 [Schizopora paradoxa]